MSIARKPKPQGNTAGSEKVDVDALINKGGSVGGNNGGIDSHRAQTATVNLRIPVSLVGRIDHLLKGRSIRTPRHTWLLEAVLEKLERDETDLSAP